MVEAKSTPPMELQRLPVLATKLAIPPQRGDVVFRPRLVAELVAASASKLVLISAPPGFGKTTLVTEWLASSSDIANVAWIALDAGDSDPGRFLTYLVSAIRTVDPQFAPGLLNLLQSSMSDSHALALVDLVNALNQLSEQVVLVLDDYHVITSEAVHDAVSFILDRQPEMFRMVMTSRNVPPLALARMRTQRQLVEIGPEDLRFTLAETTNFLNGVMNLNLASDQIERLERRTEGWIAGLLLAALSASGDREAESSLDFFGGDHRYVFDYLAEEVVQRQPPTVQAFLEDTAVLERLSRELARDFAGEGQEMLEYLVSSNLFTVPLDDRRAWYRYHHLFGEFLSARLRERDPERWSKQHRRASDWFRDNEFLFEAVEHALAANDDQRLMDLLERTGTELVRRGRISTVSRWLDALPEDRLIERPSLVILKATVLMFSFRLDEALSWLDWLVLDDSLDDDDALALKIEIASTRATAARFAGDLDEVVRQSNLCLELYQRSSWPDDPSSCVPLLHLGAVHEMSGQPLKAVEMLRNAIDRAASSEHHLVELNAMSHLTAALQDLGRFAEAEKTGQETIDLERKLGLRRVAMTEAARIALARIFHERLQYDDAHALALDTVRTVEATGERRDLGAQVHALYACALVEAARGNATAAIDTIEDAMRRAQLPAGSVVAQWRVGALVAQIQLLVGRYESAQPWADEQEFPTHGPISYPDELAAMVRAWVDIDRGNYDDAIRLLNQLLIGIEESGRAYRLGKAQLLLAAAHHLRGEPARAEGLIDGVVDYMLAEECKRLLIETHPAVWPLIPAARARAIERGLDWPGEIDEMLGALDSPEGDAPTPDQTVLLEPLTPRELEVLDLLAEGISNRAIGERLFVSLGTVKRHTHNIYGKLEVNNRTQAIIRGQELGILK